MLVPKRSLGSQLLTVGRDAAPMVHRNAYRPDQIEIPRIVFIKTWRIYIWAIPFGSAGLQLVLGKGLVYQEV